MAEQVTTSQIDPALRPFLTTGLERAQQLFLTGPQPTFFQGQTYVSPSEQTLAALQQREDLARTQNPLLQQAQQAFGQSLTGVGQTAGGAFLGGSPYRDQMIQAATRPLMQQFEQSTLPALQSAFSRAGRYGSGAQERAIGQATEATGRAIGDISTQIAAQDYARERALQVQAQQQQAALAAAAPSVYGQQFIPSEQLAQVGAAREAIAMQPLQEEMARFQFGQQLPYEQLSGYLSSVYGTPLGGFGQQTTQMPENRLMSGVAGAGLGYLGGQVLTSYLGGSPFSLTSPSGYGLAGAGLGGLLGGFI
jgi:hypothetical protein